LQINFDVSSHLNLFSAFVYSYQSSISNLAFSGGGFLPQTYFSQGRYQFVEQSIQLGLRLRRKK